MNKSLTAAALAAACAGAPASAATIILNDIGGVAGSPAARGFRVAAGYWEQALRNNVTIKLDVGFEPLGDRVLGSTGSNIDVRQTRFVESRIAARASGSAVDQAVLNGGLPALNANGSLQVVTPGFVDDANKLGVDTSKAILQTGDDAVNRLVGLTTANGKAIGYVYDPAVADATIKFSSTFPFDFDPRNGIAAGTYDFIGVAIHEIGHALGFISGADDYDFVGGPNGPAAGAVAGEPVNDFYWGYTLDLFRYSKTFDGQARLDWRPGVDAYTSVDGGQTALGAMSTGSFNGNGDQASHWLAPQSAPFCTGFIGIMNPYLCNGRNSAVTGTDLAAFDAIGWNIRPAYDSTYLQTTRDIAIAAGVPEPATWALMILGFGAVGVTARRRRALAA